MKLRKPNILIMCTSPNLSTGYSIVGNHLWKGLSDEGFDTYYFGLNVFGFQENKWLLPVAVDEGGADILEEYIKTNNIDILITIIDNWQPKYNYIEKVIKQTKIKWICHVTANSTPIPYELFNNIKGADLLIAPSNFVNKEIKRSGLMNVKTIYHGVDTHIFTPVKHKENKPFIFVSVGTNKHLQKNWGSLIRSFKKMCEIYNLEDVRLACVSEPNSPEGFNFIEMIKKYGNDKVILVGIKRNIGMTSEQMTEIYQQSHCLVSASTGESFGLPLIEAMSCGIPVIAPEYTATGELITESSAGFSVCKAYNLVIPLLVDSFLIDENDLIESMYLMYNLYNDKKEGIESYDEMCKNGRLFAEKNDWKKIIPLWTESINEVFKPTLNYKIEELGV